METEHRTLVGTVAGKDASDGSAYLDELAKGVADGTISRRQALKWIGAGAVAFAIGSLFPEQAEALTTRQRRRRQRRRCLRRLGTPLEKGNCHCGWNCVNGATATACQDNPNCVCLKTTENRGFCARGFLSGGTACTTSEGCPAGTRCVVNICGPGPVCAPECPG
jgi:hypothetical protein